MNAADFGVRPCGPNDAEALSLVAQATILETYAGVSEGSDLYTYVSSALSVEKFRDLLSSDGARAWIVETTNGRCAVGYALLLAEGDPAEPFATAQLERLYLFHRFHGQGLGKRLLSEVLAFARAQGTKLLTLRVYTLNTQAIGVYERCGFKTVAEEPFRAGERDYRVLVMHLTL